MKPVFDTENGSEYTRTVRKCSNVMIVSLLMALFILSFTEEAWSFEAYHAGLGDNMAVNAVVTTPASYHSTHMSISSGQKNSILADALETGAADTCRPLLSSLRHASLHTAVDRNQHSAGKAAALGLIFGVRFALSPLHDTAKNVGNSNARLDVLRPDSFAVGSAGNGNHSALAVVAYRQCQKRQALQALNSVH